MITIATLLFSQFPSSYFAQAYTPCNCVIFRLDDIEDQGNSDVPNTAIMQYFIANGYRLMTDLIVSRFGNLGPSGTVYQTVQQGYNAGLFELGIHGYNHVQYAQLTEQQQSSDFAAAKSKLNSLFSNPSLRVVGPPFNSFDSDTIKATAENNLDIFTTSYNTESSTSNIYKVSNSYQTDNSVIELSQVTVHDNSSGQYVKRNIYHVPFNISFLELIQPNGSLSGQNLVNTILSKAATQIANTGFAVIVIHPTDIAPYNPATASWSDSVNDSKFQDVKNTVSALQGKGYSFNFMSDVVPAPQSVVVSGPASTASLAINSIANVAWGTGITVTGRLADSSSGAGLANENITFDGTGASNLKPVTTNSDGTFTASGVAPSAVATGWTVQAHFAGDSTYSATSSLQKAYNTFAHTVFLGVAASKGTVPWGTPTSFTATMTDTTPGVPSGTPVAGRTVTLDGTGVIAVNPPSGQTTNSNGIGVFTGTAPTTVGTGWTYQAHFAGDSLYKAQNSAVKTYVTSMHTTSISLTKPSAPWGQNVTLTATLIDKSLGTPLSGVSIVFDNNGATSVGSAQTGTDGKANIRVSSPATVGTFSYAAHYSGDGSLYNGSNGTGSYVTTRHAVSLGLAVLKPGDPPGTTNTTVSQGGKYTAQGALLDLVTSGPLAVSETITFTSTAPITLDPVTTNTNGFYYSAQNAPMTDGSYNIQSHFAGDALYNSKDSQIRTLTVSANTAASATAPTPSISSSQPSTSPSSPASTPSPSPSNSTSSVSPSR
jgi:peptidoglycan/xylan/chitin deacetylase (PgdA/CDA1 family)